MRNRSFILTLCVSCLLLLSSCYQLTAHVETTDKPILLNRNIQYANAPKSNFVSQGSQIYLFWGLVGNDNTAIQDKLLEQLGPHQALQNVKVSTENSFGDMFISVITLGIVTPRSFTLTGEIVK